MNLQKWRYLLLLLSVLVLEAASPAPLEQDELPAVVIEPKSREAMVYANRYGISYRLSSAIIEYADKWSIPHKIAFRLVKRESNFDSMALNSSSSAAGLTQVVLPTARGFDPCLTRLDLLNPETSLNIGFWFLKRMNQRYHGDWWRTLVAYHDGPGVADTLEYGFHMHADYVLLQDH